MNFFYMDLANFRVCQGPYGPPCRSAPAQALEATKGSRDDRYALKVWDILDGIVYLSTLEIFRDSRSPSWFLSFCLETRKLEKLFRKTIDNDGFPYIMAWPPSLVRNNLSP